MSKGKILILDDEEETLNTLTPYLRDQGLPCESCLSATKALTHLRSGQFSVLITDYAMPELTGPEIIEVVNAEMPHIRCALMTGFGYDPSHSILHLHSNYGIPVLLKPFDFKDGTLLTTIQALHKGSALNRGEDNDGT